MDPVTTFLIVALSLVAKKVTKEVAKKAITDRCEGLKRLLKKFGIESDVAATADKLQSKTDSNERQKGLSEELSATGAVANAELIRIATVLLEQIDTLPGSAQHMQIAHGMGIAQAAGNMSAANAAVYGSSPPRND
jgi:hypothetical protein